jgi:hypothetical protein
MQYCMSDRLRSCVLSWPELVEVQPQFDWKLLLRRERGLKHRATSVALRRFRADAVSCLKSRFLFWIGGLHVHA